MWQAWYASLLQNSDRLTPRLIIYMSLEHGRANFHSYPDTYVTAQVDAGGTYTNDPRASEDVTTRKSTQSACTDLSH